MAIPSSEQRYMMLRKRLDQLGFQQPLGMDSLPLVQRLLADLVRTTTSLKNARKGASGSSLSAVGPPVGAIDAPASLSLALGQSSLESYKNENARLVRENTDIHLKLLREKEDREKTVKDLKSNFRKVEHQNTDLRFLNSQYLHKLNSLEQESNEKTKKILKLQEKNFQAVVQTPGGNKKKVPFRRQRMDIESLLPPGDPLTISQGSSAKVSLDLIAVSDKRIASLENELADLEHKAETLTSSARDLQNQLDARDTEIARLQRLLDGGRPEAAVDASAREDAMQRMAQRMNDQITLLTEENKALHDQVAEFRSGETSIKIKTTPPESVLDPALIKSELESLTTKVAELKAAKERVVSDKSLEVEETKVRLKEVESLLEARERELSDARLIFEAEKEAWTKKLLEFEENETTSLRRLEELEEELRNSRREFLELKNLVTLQKSQLDGQRHDLVTTEKNRRIIEDELAAERSTLVTLRNKEDNLRGEVKFLEEKVFVTQKQLQETSDDKDRIQLKLIQVQNELEHAYLKMIKGPDRDVNENITEPSSTDRLVAHSVVKRLESERESLLKDRKALTEEKASVEARMASIEQKSLQTQTESMRQVNQLESRVSGAERERDNALAECSHLRETLQSMRQHLHTMERQLRVNHDELREERGHVAELRTQCAAAQEETIDLRRQLSAAASSVSASGEKTMTVETKVKELSLKLHATKNELEKAKAALSVVDKERDLAQEALDDKTEQLVNLTAEMNNIKDALKNKETEIKALEEELDRQSSDIETREKQLRHLQEDVRSRAEVENEYRQEKEALSRRNRKLTEDAAELTSEIQRLNLEGETVRDRLSAVELELLREQANLSQASKIVEGSHSHHEELVQQIQAMSSQMQLLDQRVRDVEGENVRLQTEVEGRLYERSQMASHVEDLQQRLRSSEDERSMSDSQSQNLATEIQELKMDLKDARQTIDTLQSDLRSLRGLAAQLDAAKEKIQLELSNKDTLCQQLNQEISDRRLECDALRSALTTEQASVVGLESVVASSREREFVSRVDMEKMRDELEARMKQLAEAKEMVVGQAAEVDGLRKIVVELESSKSSVEAELTNLQYEAELSGRSPLSNVSRMKDFGEKRVVDKMETKDSRTRNRNSGDVKRKALPAEERKFLPESRKDCGDASAAGKRKPELPNPRLRRDSDATSNGISGIESDEGKSSSEDGNADASKPKSLSLPPDASVRIALKSTYDVPRAASHPLPTGRPDPASPSSLPIPSSHPQLVPTPDPGLTPSLRSSPRSSPISAAGSPLDAPHSALSGRRSPLSSTPTSSRESPILLAAEVSKAVKTRMPGTVAQRKESNRPRRSPIDPVISPLQSSSPSESPRDSQ